MSTQLIVYPQNYDGQFSSTSNPSSNEFIVNGINFTGFNLTTSYVTSAGNPSDDAILNSPPAILGNWYRYYTSGGPWAGIPIPLLIGSNLTFFWDGAAIGHSGIYQRLSGLAVGGTYDVVINITPVVGIATIRVYTGNVMMSDQAIGTNVSQLTYSFTANSANDTILIDYSSQTGLLLVQDISVKESATSPTLTFSDLYDGQVICDLYEEENIPLTLSIDDFKNVAEKVQSYSKGFSLPATKRNNKIFDNMFEITRADDKIIFNPYVKTKCVLKQDGFLLFEGYLRLIDVKDQEGEISYNVNLYSDVIALADKLKDKTFADLDFSELEHDYEKDSIKNSWNDPSTTIGLPLINPLLPSSFAYNSLLGTNQTNVLKYPFIDWTGSCVIAGTGGTPTAGNPILSDLESAFRPCIQLKYLINRIFADAGFDWTSTFFDSADFENLYMDFNWGGGLFPFPESTFNASWIFGTGATSNVGTGVFKALRLIPESVTGGAVNSELPPNYDTTTYTITATTTNEMYNITFNWLLKNTSGVSQTCGCRWIHTIAGVAQSPINAVIMVIYPSLHKNYNGSFDIALNTGDTLVAEFNATSDIEQSEVLISSAIFVQSSALVNSAGILSLRGELGQWDFLKGIMTMFNLVSLADESNAENILIEPYSDVFIENGSGTNLASRGIQHDWTDKIDVSQMQLTPLTELNKETIFHFVEDDDDYVFNVYKNSTSGHLYGSKEIDASGFTILEGIKEIVAEPFAATVSKPLFAQSSDFITPSIYAMEDNGTPKGFNNSPRVFYNNGIKSTGASYYIPAQNGLFSENQTFFLQFSHLSEVPTIAGTRDFLFESQQLVSPIGNPPTDNLFSVYWQPYFNELYNPDTRTLTLKVNLTAGDINKFKFYDKVYIKNRSFRVNKIQYKPNSLATVEFILIG